MTASERQDGFDWLDEHLVESLETPDQAFDWVYMLSDREWETLYAVWDERPVEWREALSYILCDGPVRQSQPILRRALFDANLQVATEAACSLCNQWNLDPHLVDLDPTIVGRLRFLFDQGDRKHLDSVAQVLLQVSLGMTRGSARWAPRLRSD